MDGRPNRRNKDFVLNFSSVVQTRSCALSGVSRTKAQVICSRSKQTSVFFPICYEVILTTKSKTDSESFRVSHGAIPLNSPDW